MAGALDIHEGRRTGRRGSARPDASRTACRPRMLDAVHVGRWLPLILLGMSGLALAAPPCPAPGTIAIQAENLAPGGTMSLRVRGELLAEDTTCAGAGAASYDTTVTCSGQGPVRCGEVPGLRPGAWVHHLDVQVAGSEAQHQSQRTVVLASAPGVSNVVGWTVFPRTFVVHDAGNDDFRTKLDMAAAFTASGPDVRALVTFDPDVFPGGGTPTKVTVGFRRGPPKSCDDPTPAPTARRPPTVSSGRASRSTRSTTAASAAASSW